MADATDRNGASNEKQRQLDRYRVDREQGKLTTQQGVRVDSTDDALKVGERGPTLLADFHAREKITHFDHERIPERVVHARGAGAYGYFRPYDGWLGDFTAARFLIDSSVETPVFVRFSTVAGSRGSADTVRDVRGFATKFYTAQGNYDLVGNNFPVFFIQDGIKFPDFVHAVKPEPHNEIPQAASAHDTLWDFVGQQPETLHAIMWLMSDRALPRSYRMMQGFGVHTFRLVNSEGRGTFVKFHWTPKLGVHSLLWDECQQVAGRDPDFNRRDLWDCIAAGQYPEWELGVQLVSDESEFGFDFDLLDPTKIIPEEQVPVQPVGRMVLDRNPDNFFAETEQVAFHTANLVPGIDFSDDPLLQLRNFSYLDTQLIRLGGPNFAQLPIIRTRVLEHLVRIEPELAERVASELGMPVPQSDSGDREAVVSPALSQLNTVTDTIATRKIAILAADGVDTLGVRRIKSWLSDRGAIPEVLAPHAGTLGGDGSDGETLPVDRSLATVASVLYDAVLVAGGAQSADTLVGNGAAVHFVLEAFKHAKPIGGFGDGVTLLRVAGVVSDNDHDAQTGVFTTTASGAGVAEEFIETFANALAQHRVWRRSTVAVPA
ncbi:catalase [Nocardia vinacea]|uniref:catalase n=1 Tax=Nocardia vinacea TaxID=96468 RepID=UPI0002E56B44|nr:catalase [Nocardia vinacea]